MYLYEVVTTVSLYIIYSTKIQANLQILEIKIKNHKENNTNCSYFLMFHQLSRMYKYPNNLNIFTICLEYNFSEYSWKWTWYTLRIPYPFSNVMFAFSTKVQNKTNQNRILISIKLIIHSDKKKIQEQSILQLMILWVKIFAKNLWWPFWKCSLLECMTPDSLCKFFLHVKDLRKFL